MTDTTYQEVKRTFDAAERIGGSAQADLIAEAVRVTFAAMSTTDKNAVQAAVLRAQRKALKDQMKALKVKEAV